MDVTPTLCANDPCTCGRCVEEGHKQYQYGVVQKVEIAAISVLKNLADRNEASQGRQPL